MLDKIAQIDALLATYDDPAGRGEARQTDNGSAPAPCNELQECWKKVVTNVKSW